MEKSSSLFYESLSPAVEEAICTTPSGYLSPYACRDEQAVRRNPAHDKSSVLRPAYSRDADKIVHSPFFNRYADKTQVFSFFKNDDITRRALHVQLVSRIARNLGRALHLNLDLIEAIALGHDIGHAPFAHMGECYLDEIYFNNTGKHFCHNLHSVRVLDGIFPYNISLQTLNGIASHDGEMELPRYQPAVLSDFETFDRQMKASYTDKKVMKKMLPCTLEGCVVRISDIIAYLGKDRQDAERAKIFSADDYQKSAIGIHNAEIINNLTVNIVENSWGKPYIEMDKRHFDALQAAKAENYALIYENHSVREQMDACIKPMMQQMYDELLKAVKRKDKTSVLYTHHINQINNAHYARSTSYEDADPETLVVDFIASMTDDYFVDLYHRMFPDSTLSVKYKGYFD